VVVVVVAPCREDMITPLMHHAVAASLATATYTAADWSQEGTIRVRGDPVYTRASFVCACARV
jgi:hypothetical protein